MIWHITGDSFVEGVGAKRNHGWAQQVADALVPDTVTIDGVGGSTINDVVHRLAKRMLSACDALVIAVGINDSRYRFSTDANEIAPDAYCQELKTLVKTTLDRGVSRIFLIGLTRVDEARTVPFKPDKAHRNDDIAIYDNILRDMADGERAVTYVPVPLLNGTRGALADGLHPSDEGHRQLLGAILPVLRSGR